MVNAVTTCFSKYMTFEGRASRPEFWYFFLFLVLGNIVCRILDASLLPAMQPGPLSGIFSLVTFIPSITVGARRLHDIDKSGWWQLLWIIPVIGWIVLLIWFASAGTPGPNRFGDSPTFAAVPA